MPSSEYFRRQAELCLRLAMLAANEDAARVLLERHHDFIARAGAVDGSGDLAPDAASDEDEFQPS